MAIKTDKIVTLLSGDMSFFYDSNAFWNNHVPSNLKVVLFNNSGGGIFRIIPGPDTTNQLETYFETQQNNTAEHICKQFGLSYLTAKDRNELESAMESLYTTEGATVLEVFTDKEVNAATLKDYFQALL